jgi:hypothetical protein
MRGRALVLAGLLALVASPRAAAAATAEVPVDQWVVSLCSAVTSYNRDQQTGVTTLQSKLSAPRLTTRDAREALRIFLTSYLRNTKFLGASIVGEGPPAVPDGAALVAVWRRGVARAADRIRRARRHVAELPEDDLQRQVALASLVREIQRSATQVRDTFTTYAQRTSGGPLDEAGRRVPECAPFVGAGGPQQA